MDDVTPTRLTRLPTWQLARAARRSHAVVAEALAEVGARGFDFRVLSALAELGPSSQIDIGRAVGLDRSDVAATVRRLEGQDALARRKDSRDKRRNVVELTENGLERLAQLEVVLDGVQRKVFATSSRAELAAMAAMLNSIAERS